MADIWLAMALLVGDVYWATLLLSLPAAVLVVRLFMIQHDCDHCSFFRSTRLISWAGRAIGVLTLTPHGYWRRAHYSHHATSGDLDRWGIGDVTMLTVHEYLTLPRSKWLSYRVYRNSLTILGIGPIFLFVVKFRLPLELLRRDRRQRRQVLASVMPTNLAVAALLAGLGLGFVDMLMLQEPIVLLYRRLSGCGYSMCSISSTTPTGDGTETGTSKTLQSRADRLAIYRNRCAGLPQISVSTMYTIFQTPPQLSSARVPDAPAGVVGRHPPHAPGQLEVSASCALRRGNGPHGMVCGIGPQRIPDLTEMGRRSSPAASTTIGKPDVCRLDRARSLPAELQFSASQ